MTRPHALVGASLGLLLFALAGCSNSPANGGPDATPTSAPAMFGHVHGLGVNPSDNRLYVASHLGVFRQTSSGFERIADRYQDTMAFTVIGDDTFLASGHPDLRETDKPGHLGLIKSTDAGNSWKALSLEGKSDFHALEPAGDRLYGYDSNDGTLKVTQDQQDWARVQRLRGLVDLAVNPTDLGDLLVTTNTGLLRRMNEDFAIPPVPDAPPLVLIDWPHASLLVGASPDGSVFRSRDKGGTWQEVGQVEGTPEALDVLPGAWHLATDRGILKSSDEGRNWTGVTTAPH